MMKKNMFFIWILSINTYLYSINNNNTHTIIFNNNTVEFFKETFDLKPEQKSNLPGFSIRRTPFENYLSTYKENYLFYTGGDILYENFETSTGWAFTNDTIGNKWVIGTAINNGGTKSLYISKDNGVNNEYDNTIGTVIHAYKEITIPTNAEEISISFDWRCLGDGINPKLHYFNIWLVPDVYYLKSGSKIKELKDKRILIGSFNNNGAAFKNENIGLDSNSLKGKKMKIVFEWINNIEGGWQPPAAIDNIKISSIKCTRPSNIIFEDIETTSALMKWDASKTTTAEYDIYYSKETNFPTSATSPVKSNIKTTSFLLDNLDSNTSYYVWIRSVCGSDKGVWSKIYQFKTKCEVLNIPFKEGFNKDSETTDCWSIIDENTDGISWKANYSPGVSFEGDQVMSLNISSSNNTTVNNDWLISPSFKMNGTYRLKYHYKVSGSNLDEFEVLLSKNGKETKDFKQTLVSKKNYNNTHYIEKKVIIDNIKGNINIAWHATGKGSSNIYIDNIIIEKIETCPEPIGLDVKTITTNNATIFWEDNYGANQWEYFVQEEENGIPKSLGTSTDKKEVTITKDQSGTNLKENTAYEYYVRTKCSDGTYSIWEGPFSFKTMCKSIGTPFSEEFNSDSNTINCWSIIDVSNDGNIITNKWDVFNSSTYEGDGVMYFKGSDNNIHNDYLISPTIKVNGENYSVTYYYKSSSKHNNEFEVLLSDNGIMESDFTTVLLDKAIYKNEDYIKKTMYFSGITGEINIAWHAVSEGLTEIYIDLVNIEEVDCIPPGEDVLVSNLKTDKVTFTWEDNYNTNWEYYVQLAGGTPPASSGYLITNKNITVDKTSGAGANKLLPNTEYEFYVRSICEAGKNSIWIGPIVFKTPCVDLSTPFPFLEGFNTDSKTVDCWRIIDNNKDLNKYGGNIWNITPASPWGFPTFEGDQMVTFTGSGTPNDDWLISPTIKLDATKVYRLKYHYITNIYTKGNAFEVLLSSEGGGLSEFTTVVVPNKTYKNVNYIQETALISGSIGSINLAWHINSYDHAYLALDNVILEEVENCPEPINLGVKEEKTKSVTLYWTDDFTSGSWEYYIQKIGTGKGEPTTNGTITTKKENTVTKDQSGNNLEPNTEYEFYTRTVCDKNEYSIWSGPYKFRTTCEVLALPYWEGFNSKSETFYCWNTGDNENWKRNNSRQYEGSHAMQLNTNNSDPSNSNSWLISPKFNFKADKFYRLKYHYRTYYDEECDFDVLASNSGIKPADFKHEIVKNRNYKANSYIADKYIISGLSGEVNIAWHSKKSVQRNLYIDNVFVEEIDSCPEPMELYAKDITPDSATLTWTDDFNASSWEYYLQEDGGDEPSGNGTITNKKENIVAIDQNGNKLKSNTDYEYYVRTVCDNGKYSIWSGPFSFATDCDVKPIPFWEGFNKNSKTLRCWTIINNNNTKNTWLNKDSYSGSFKPFEGDQMMLYSGSDSPNDDWLISPTFKMDTDKYVLKYHYMSYLGELEVLLSSEGIEIDKFMENIVPNQSFINTNDWEEKVVFFDGIKGDVNFAWHITKYGQTNFYLDNVIFKKVETCSEPYYVIATNQTTNSIDIEWNQEGGNTEWEVIVVEYGKDETSTPIKTLNIKDNPNTSITGLDSGKAYTIYVRTKCSDGKSFSDWSTVLHSGTKVGANDNCIGAVNIPVNATLECDKVTNVTTIEGSLSTVTKPVCFNPRINVDLWFEFTATSNIHQLSVKDFKSFPREYIPEIKVALYDQDCTSIGLPTTNPKQCLTFYSHVPYNKIITNLVVGQKYYVRLGIPNSGNNYIFNLCITTSKHGPIEVSPSGDKYTTEELVKDVLVKSNCDLVSDVKYQNGDGSPEAQKINTLGYFNSNNSIIPFKEGIALSTSQIEYVPGPHLNLNYGSNPHRWKGDKDINDAIADAGGGPKPDKRVTQLEFDFIPIKDSLRFDYLFASNSYSSNCIFSCDVAALFAAWLIDTETGKGQNLAKIPGTNTPISLNTIRDVKKSKAPCSSENPEYYWKHYVHGVDNPIDSPIAFAGLTKPMSSEKVYVIPGRKYHIKLAVMDFCPNDSHSSVVLFNAGSFNLDNLDLGDDLLIKNGNALCNGETRTIKSGLGTEEVDIKWYKNEVLIPDAIGPDFNITESGTYKVVAIYEKNGCEVTGEITAEVYPPISTVVNNPNPLTVCRNTLVPIPLDLSLSEASMFDKSIRNNYKTGYYKNLDDAELGINAIDSIFKFKSQENLEIFIRVDDLHIGCHEVFTLSINLEKGEIPTPKEDVKVCTSYTFPSLEKNQYYYSKPGAGGVEYKAGDVLIESGVHIIYILQKNDEKGCYEETSYKVNIIEGIKADVIKDIVVECEVYQLQALSKLNRYFTQPGGTGEELTVGSFVPLKQTIYIYASSEDGICVDESAFTVSYNECPIPKGISPNGDGLNDFLDLRVHGVTNIVIYNRYGMEVYSHGSDYTNQWHGQSNSGNQLPDGTYYYVIEARGKTRTGWIQINR